MSNKIILDSVTIRLAGDSGDGVQLLGNQISDVSVLYSNNDIYSFVEFPPEIRAPVGTISGISGFQLSISKRKIFAIEDFVDLLVVMNPAALKSNICYLKDNGILIFDSDTFNEKSFLKANLSFDFLNKNNRNFKILEVPITNLTYNSVKDFLDSVAKAKKSRNMFVLGLICWIYDRDINGILNILKNKFGESVLFTINKNSLLAGYNYGDNLELLHKQFYIPSFVDKNLDFKRVSGNIALSLGIVATSIISKSKIFSAGYPITPASEILQNLTSYKIENVISLQLEDEISVISSAIGAAYGGSLSVVFTSGPGLDLMSEGLGLAIMSELPLVLIDIQRVGPSTGIPTKSEQTDLLSAVFGRHGESPLVVLAPDSPSDCFWIVLEAFYLSIKYLTPVIVLSDANLANSSELWEIPAVNNSFFDKYSNIEKFLLLFNESRFYTYLKVDSAKPKIGGLERNKETGCVSYEPDNHFRMVKFRANKISSVVDDITKLNVVGALSGNLLVVTWGSVCGVIKSIHRDFELDGFRFSLLCLRYLNPLPKVFINLVSNYKKIIVIEENMGQLSFLLKSKYFLNVLEINQVTGKPFAINSLKKVILYNI